MGVKITMTTEAPVDFEKMSQDSRGPQTVIQDDDTISVRKEALGDDLPKGYFYSVGFLGALAVSTNARISPVFDDSLDTDAEISRASVSPLYLLISFYCFQLIS
jgi:hypothetical protein